MLESPRLRSRAHMDWVASQPCAVFGRGRTRVALPCYGRIEVHHVRTGQSGGMGLKPGDQNCVGLCIAHHRQIHEIGVKTFEVRYSVDLKAVADEMAALSPILSGTPEPA
jgi:hypothetical protein